jgi:hypothetical protein
MNNEALLSMSPLLRRQYALHTSLPARRRTGCTLPVPSAGIAVGHVGPLAPKLPAMRCIV